MSKEVPPNPSYPYGKVVGSHNYNVGLKPDPAHPLPPAQYSIYYSAYRTPSFTEPSYLTTETFPTPTTTHQTQKAPYSEYKMMHGSKYPSVLPHDESSYNSGRWMKEEHEKFLEGLEKYGKSWKDIATLIPTRSLVQIRTHAQKYFQKQERLNSPMVSGLSSKSTLEEKKEDLESLNSDKLSLHQPAKSPALGSIKSGSSTPARTYVNSLVDQCSLHQKATLESSLGSKSLNTPSNASGTSSFKSEPFVGTYSGKTMNTVPNSTNVLPGSVPSSYAPESSLFLSGAKDTFQSKSPYYLPQPYGESFVPNPLSQPSILSYSSLPKKVPSSIFAYEPAAPQGISLASSSPGLLGPEFSVPYESYLLPNYNYLYPPRVTPTLVNLTSQPLYGEIAPLQSQRVLQMLYIYGEQEKKELEKELERKQKQEQLELENKKEEEQILEQQKMNEELVQKIQNMKEKEKEEKEKEESESENSNDALASELNKNIQSYAQKAVNGTPKEPETPETSLTPISILNPDEIENEEETNGEEKKTLVEAPVEEPEEAPVEAPSPFIIFHHVVAQGNLEELHALIVKLSKEEDNIDQYINHKDVYGYTPLMTGVCLSNEDLAYSIVEILLKYGADLNLGDREGNTAFHWAARVGHANILKLIFNSGFSPNTPNGEGNTALHIACQYNRISCVELLLDEMKVDETLRNHKNQTALEIIYDPETVLSLSSRDELKSILYTHFPYLKTLVIYHPNCLLHIPRKTGSQGENPWEAPERLQSIIEHIHKDLYDWEYEISSDFEPIENSKLKGIHSDQYIHILEELDAQLNRGNVESVAFTPRVQKGQGVPETQLKADDSCDTSFSKGTLLAARTAAGGTCYAIDQVVKGHNRNAFVCVRPPGHHAGVDGLLTNSSSCGFCIYNNIFIGAVHALKTYPELIKKVAIFDIDIHHGNGTEQLVQHYNRPDQIMFWSFHIYYSDNDEDYSFYPGTGSDHDLIHNVFNTPLVPIWAPNRYNNKDCEDERGRPIYRKCVDRRLIPALRSFNPDLILVSAGFDGGYLDTGNYGALSNGCSGMNLKSEDYRYILHKVQEVADICCQGRVVTVLEGGYGNYERVKKTKDTYVINRNSLAVNVIGHLKGLLGYTTVRSHGAHGGSNAFNDLSRSEEISTRSHSTRFSHGAGSGRYCCCGGNTDCKTMIECVCGKECGGWVHLTCAGIDGSQDIHRMENFICKWCRTAGIENVSDLYDPSQSNSTHRPKRTLELDEMNDGDSISSSQKGSRTRGRKSRRKNEDSFDDDDDRPYQRPRTSSIKNSSYGFRPNNITEIREIEETKQL